MTERMCSLKINGKEKLFNTETLPETLADLLSRLEIHYATVVAEIDGTIVKRKDFAATRIKPGQSIELIRLVGGG